MFWRGTTSQHDLLSVVMVSVIGLDVLAPLLMKLTLFSECL
jgi:hypothetical protein